MTGTRTALAIWRNSVIFFSAVLLCSALAFAEEPACRSKSGAVKAVYPDLARRMKIGGVVRLHLDLTSTGTVRDIKVLGGNPVLVSAAQDAVKQTKFEGSESCIIVFQFKE